MSSQPSSIRPLSPESQAQIRSSVVITSLNDAVMGLLENVLDASATCADIRLDYVKGYCSMTDNGIGIPVAEFGTDGHLGSLHCTSKLDASRSTYGRYGRFLYHIAALSLLSITSRCGSSASAITFHRAKIAARSNGDGEYAEAIRGEHGTHVVVANLFGDIPVRYRHIAARLESIPLAEAEFSILKKRITALVLACDRPIDIKVADVRTRRTYKHKSHASERRNSFELPAICSTLQQAGYVDYSQDASFKLVSLQTSSIRIRAAISLHPAPAKDLQFVSIGIWPLYASTAASLFQDEINTVFELSSFGTVEGDIDLPDDEQDRRRKDQRFASDRHTNRQLNRPKKGVDKWPMFYVRIDPQDCGPLSALDDERSKPGPTEKWVEKVLDLLRSMFYEFLSVYHFRPRVRKRRRLERTSLNPVAPVDSHPLPARILASAPQILPSRTASGALLVPKHFDAWSRVKSRISAAKPMQISSSSDKQGHLETSEPDNFRPQTPAEIVQLAQNALGEMELQALGDEDLQLLVEDYDDDEVHFNDGAQSRDGAQILDGAEDRDQISIANTTHTLHSDEAAYLWTDPATGIEHKINARNGFIVPHMNVSSTNSSIAVNAASSHRPTTTPAEVTISERIRGRPAKKSPAELITSLRQNKLIHSFRPIEAEIPSVVPDKLNDTATAQQSYGCARSHRTTSEYFSVPANTQSHSLSKTNLESARVISQVDQKFILVQIQPTDSSDPLLVLIDQHAADERVKVEDLYSQLRSGETTTLVKPIIFEVPRKEIELFARHQARFMQWQVVYRVKHTSPGTDPTKQIVVNALPSLISERCRLDPKLLIDLLRREVHCALPTSSSSPNGSSSNSNWIHRIPHCPAGLVEMVNSRACRSAIMFNDVLDVAQCEELVRQLAKCTLPFQCAHGRPSCVVLPGWGGKEGVENLKREVGFVEGFRRWKDL